MPATMKGAISFGLLHVPISLHTATQDNDIRFHQLCREDGSRVKYKKVCASCGKEVSGDGIVKGFEIEPGRYVTLTDDDFEKAKAERERTIHTALFTLTKPTIPFRRLEATRHMSCCAAVCWRNTR